MRYLPHSCRQPTRVLSNLGFTPNSLTSLQIGDDTLIAAGGQDTEIHLSLHTPSSSNGSSGRRRRTRVQWEFEDNLQGSINNSVLLTSLSLSRSNESNVDPRVGISNNDGSVRLYDVPMRVSNTRRNRKLHAVGEVRLDVPVNHCESLVITFRTLGAAAVFFLDTASFSSSLCVVFVLTFEAPVVHKCGWNFYLYKLSLHLLCRLGGIFSDSELEFFFLLDPFPLLLNHRFLG